MPTQCHLVSSPLDRDIVPATPRRNGAVLALRKKAALVYEYSATGSPKMILGLLNSRVHSLAYTFMCRLMAEKPMRPTLQTIGSWLASVRYPGTVPSTPFRPEITTVDPKPRGSATKPFAVASRAAIPQTLGTTRCRTQREAYFLGQAIQRILISDSALVADHAGTSVSFILHSNFLGKKVNGPSRGTNLSERRNYRDAIDFLNPTAVPSPPLPEFPSSGFGAVLGEQPRDPVQVNKAECFGKLHLRGEFGFQRHASINCARLRSTKRSLSPPHHRACSAPTCPGTPHILSCAEETRRQLKLLNHRDAPNPVYALALRVLRTPVVILMILIWARSRYLYLHVRLTSRCPRARAAISDVRNYGYLSFSIPAAAI
ncbi:hypothetical protein B0H11DRAFT_2303430 [Mycena galericulata]|nr:hypothetical protein B0H11DRAFT_2303430 [Mycena galericulata]